MSPGWGDIGATGGSRRGWGSISGGGFHRGGGGTHQDGSPKIPATASRPHTQETSDVDVHVRAPSISCRSRNPRVPPSSYGRRRSSRPHPLPSRRPSASGSASGSAVAAPEAPASAPRVRPRRAAHGAPPQGRDRGCRSRLTASTTSSGLARARCLGADNPWSCGPLLFGLHFGPGALQERERRLGDRRLSVEIIRRELRPGAVWRASPDRCATVSHARFRGHTVMPNVLPHQWKSVEILDACG